MIDPKKDGVDHINIYSKGVTTLGRALSNWAPAKIVTEEGEFRSVEGYWFYLGTNHPDKNKLKNLVGFEAKKVGTELSELSPARTNNFEEKIVNAIKYKINNSFVPELRKEFYSSTLPFEHYYVYSGRVVIPKEFQWIVKGIEEIRKVK